MTRTKSNTAYKVVNKLDVSKADKKIILSDDVIHLTNKNPRGKKVNKYANKDIRLVTVLVPDRERNRSEGKSVLKQHISLFEENSWLFDENNGKLWSNPAFPQ